MLQLGLIDKDNRSFAEDVARGRQENYRDAYILYLAYIFPEVVTRRTFKREMTDSGGIIRDAFLVDVEALGVLLLLNCYDEVLTMYKADSAKIKWSDKERHRCHIAERPFTQRGKKQHGIDSGWNDLGLEKKAELIEMVDADRDRAEECENLYSNGEESMDRLFLTRYWSAWNMESARAAEEKKKKEEEARRRDKLVEERMRKRKAREEKAAKKMRLKQQHKQSQTPDVESAHAETTCGENNYFDMNDVGNRVSL